MGVYRMKTIERAEVVDNKYCSACAAGAACLADGPIPDFEVVAAAGLLGLAN
ncbi:MAG: subtilosin A family bacteriocin [Clostridium sp.]|nr:subtilosin A family bacteriocin [Clostridium sp.]